MKDLEKGNFRPINEEAQKLYKQAFELIREAMIMEGKTDQHTVLISYRDKEVCRMISYDNINDDKHGMDARDEKEHYIESKTCSFKPKNTSAVFNDMTIENAQHFKNKNVMICFTEWLSTVEPSFGVIGQNPSIGDFFIRCVENHKKKGTSRCSPHISFNEFVFKYNFKIVAFTISKSEVVRILKERSKRLYKNLTEEDILSVEEWIEYKNNFYKENI